MPLTVYADAFPDFVIQVDVEAFHTLHRRLQVLQETLHISDNTAHVGDGPVSVLHELESLGVGILFGV